MRILAALAVAFLVNGAAAPAVTAADAGHGGHGGALQVEPPVDVKQALAGNTITAQIFRSRPEPVVRSGGTRSVDRMLLHAWLKDDGAAVVKFWDEPGQRWLAPVEQSWTVDGGTFCLASDRLEIGLDRMCVETLVWGQVFSGTGIGSDIMVKGHVRKGNAEGL